MPSGDQYGARHAAAITNSDIMAALGLIVTLITTAARWARSYYRRSGERRRHRQLIEFDDLAARAELGEASVSLAAAEYSVTPQQLRDWAAGWNMLRTGPEQYARIAKRL